MVEFRKDTGIVFRVTRKALSNNEEYIEKINKDPYRYFHIPSYYIQAILEVAK